MSASPPVVEVTEVAKSYRLYPSPWARLRDLALGGRLHDEHPALTDVSFTLGHGEALGVIGENGAGKSTLLKILAGIVAPSRGTVRVDGSVAAILELGAGFHPEFSGRQNAVLNAAILGLSEQEVSERLPGIIEFSELGEFIDRPVKSYSTGMAMRLAFAIATQVRPDVLIIDEALAVGDGYFQKKCIDHLVRYLRDGGTLLFCSHAMYYVTSFCQQALWLREGRPQQLGPVEEVVGRYEEYLLAKTKAHGGGTASTAPPPRPSPSRLRRIEVLGAGDGVPVEIGFRRPLHLEVEWTAEDTGVAHHLGVGINRVDGLEVCSFATHLDGLPAFSGRPSYRVRLELPELPFVKGEFGLHVYLVDEEGLAVYDRKVVPNAFRIAAGQYAFGLVQPVHRWVPVSGGAVTLPAVSAPVPEVVPP